MPQLDFFSLLHESDYQCASRSGWRYRRDSPVYMPVQSIHIMPPWFIVWELELFLIEDDKYEEEDTNIF